MPGSQLNNSQQTEQPPKGLKMLRKIGEMISNMIDRLNDQDQLESALMSPIIEIPSID